MKTDTLCLKLFIAMTLLMAASLYYERAYSAPPAHANNDKTKPTKPPKPPKDSETIFDGVFEWIPTGEISGPIQDCSALGCAYTPLIEGSAFIGQGDEFASITKVDITDDWQTSYNWRVTLDAADLYGEDTTAQFGARTLGVYQHADGSCGMMLQRMDYYDASFPRDVGWASSPDCENFTYHGPIDIDPQITFGSSNALIYKNGLYFYYVDANTVPEARLALIYGNPMAEPPVPWQYHRDSLGNIINIADDAQVFPSVTIDEETGNVFLSATVPVEDGWCATTIPVYFSTDGFNFCRIVEDIGARTDYCKGLNLRAEDGYLHVVSYGYHWEAELEDTYTCQ